MAASIQLEWTPNPSSLKYVVDRPLLERGVAQFSERAAAAAKSPLAARLLALEGVTAVMIGADFVTVTKAEDNAWDLLSAQVVAALEAHLDSGAPALSEAAAEAVSSPGGVEAKIREFLDQEVRPAVARDGGDISLDRFEGGVAFVILKGSCAGCPSSSMTLKMGIEARLCEEIPEVKQVVAL